MIRYADLELAVARWKARKTGASPAAVSSTLGGESATSSPEALGIPTVVFEPTSSGLVLGEDEIEPSDENE